MDKESLAKGHIIVKLKTVFKKNFYTQQYRLELLKKYWLPIFALFVYAAFVNPPVCLLMMGVILCFFSISGLILIDSLKKTGVYAEGMIVRFKMDNEGHKTPIIRFETIEMKTIEAAPYIYSSASFNGIMLHEYDQKELGVLYLPKDPKKFVIAGEHIDNKASTIIIGIFGIGIFILGICELLGITNLM